MLVGFFPTELLWVMLPVVAPQCAPTHNQVGFGDDLTSLFFSQAHDHGDPLPLSEKHTLYEAVYRAVCRSVSLSAIAPRQQKEVCHIGPQRRELCRP